jgi:hypothetical protein
MIACIVYGLGFAITFKWMAEGLSRTEGGWPVLAVSLVFSVLWPVAWFVGLLALVGVLVVTRGRP